MRRNISYTVITFVKHHIYFSRHFISTRFNICFPIYIRNILMLLIT